MNSTQLSTLKSEHDADPLARGYAGMTPGACASDMNAPTRPAPVPSETVRRYLMLKGKWAAISDDAAHGLTAEQRQPCLSMVDALAMFDDFDLQDPQIAAAVTAVLDALIASGHIDATDKAAIFALGDDQRPRSAELGLPKVRAGHIEQVRAT